MSRELGRQWELEFMELCLDRGYDVHDAADSQVTYDLIVNGLHVQCKRLRRNGGQFFIGRGGASGVAPQYRKGDFDVLALRSAPTRNVYIVPERFLWDQRHEMIRRTVSVGIVMPFINNFELLHRGGDRDEQTTEGLLF